MKRILMTGLSALTLMGGFAGTAAAQDYGRYNHQNDGRDGRGDWNRGRDNDRRDNDRRDNDRGRFEQGRYDNQFNRNWRRGDRLPGGWQNRYRNVDYRYYHLRPAPYGYRYVRDDSGRILLVGIFTGVILSAIFSNY
ncbi:MAG: RcnB family protein [Vitreimonas sp.]